MIGKTILLGAFFASTTLAWAGEKPVYAPSPDWVTMAAAPDPRTLDDKAPVFLVMDHQQRFADGQVWAYYDGATRVASADLLGRLGTIQLEWDPDKGDLIIHGLTIIRAGETVDLLAGGKQLSVIRREQQLEQRALDGRLTATMPVEGLRVGDVLRMRFSITRKDPTLGGEMQGAAPLAAEPVRVQFGRLRVLWPEGQRVALRSYAGTPVPDATKGASGDRVVEMKLPIAKLAELPDDIPVRLRPLPLIDISSYTDWAGVGRTMAPLYRTQGLIAAGSPLAREVAAIAKASTDPRTRAAAALRLVQDQVRYLFNGMAQGNYVPQTPADTWSLRYGDCKAKTLLLLAILHELGIEAEAAAVSSELGDYLPARLPMPGAFDHVIVRAVIDGKTLWLDGTSSGDRIADLDDAPPFRHALPLRMAGATLEAIPLRPTARPEIDVAVDIDASTGIAFAAPFTASLTLRGAAVPMLRAASAAIGKEETDKMIDGIIGEHVETSTFVGRKLHFDEVAGTAVISASGITYPRWGLDNQRNKLTVDRAVQGIGFNPDRSRTAWRDLPVSTGTPENRRVRVSYRLPRGGAGFTLEGMQSFPAQIAGRTLNRRVSLADGTLTVEDQTIVTGVDLAKEEIATARKDVAQVKARMLRLVAASDHPPRWQEYRSGAFGKALAILDRAVADTPDKADPYVARHWFHARTFNYAAGIKDLDKAIALAPSVFLHLQRAVLFDLIGQHDRAIADADTARELDPGSANATRFAIDYRGHKRDYAAAIAIADEQIDLHTDKLRAGFIAQRAQILAWSGKTGEAIAAMDALIEEFPTNAVLFNTRCWIKGTMNVELESALKDCTRALEIGGNWAGPLDSRGLIHFRMGRMEEAQADLDAALRIDPDQAGSLFLRAVIRKAQGARDTAAADLAGARLISPGIDRKYAAWNIRP